MAFFIRKLLLLQLVIVFFLMLMHFFPERLSGPMHRVFDLDAESNIPTWFSTVLLFSVCLSSSGIHLLSFGHTRSRTFWPVFSFVYCFLSLDEAARFHEHIDRVTSIKWVFVYAPFAGAFFMICAYHLIKSDNQILRNWILGGLVVYALGGLGGESISYLLRPLSPLLQQLEIVLEEGLEMIGTVIVLTGCLQEVNRLWSRG